MSARRFLLLGARGAVGRVVARELEARGHVITRAGRTAPEGGIALDARYDHLALSRAAARHDVVVNASGVESIDAVRAVGDQPFVEVSATSSYLERLLGVTSTPVLAGAGLVPGLSTALVSAVESGPGDEVDVFVMLGSGEAHGPAAVAWTASLVGSDVHAAPEGTRIPNLRSTRFSTDPNGTRRRYLRADFPDHVLVGARRIVVRSYLALSSPTMTLALAAAARIPSAGRLLSAAPHLGSDAWHVVVRNRRSGEVLSAQGNGQSEATGVLVALAAERMLDAPRRPVTMPDVLDLDALSAVVEIRRRPPVVADAR